MKRFLCFLSVVIYVLVAGGFTDKCQAQSETKTGEGAIIGGLLGATAGGVIGHQKKKTTQGALIGGALGALGGAMVGSQMKNPPATTAPVEQPAVKAGAVSDAESVGTTDQTSSEPVAQNVQAVSGATQYAPKVTMKQIVYWTEQGLPSDEIISRIKKANATFVLTADDIAYLQKQGVSQLVIEAMQEK